MSEIDIQSDIQTEIIMHPNRFHGCVFCRRPLRDLIACTICRLGFDRFVRDSIQPDNLMLSNIRNQSKNLTNKIIESGYIKNREFIFRDIDLDKKFEWVGFYAGITNLNLDLETEYYLPTWIIPKTLKIDSSIKNIFKNTFTNPTKIFETELLNILEHNNIYLNSNVQIDLEKFDLTNIESIFRLGVE